LTAEFRVRLVAGAAGEPQEALAVLRQNKITVRLAPIPHRTAWRDLFGAVTAAVQREPYVLYRRHNHASMRTAVQEEIQLESPDVLYLDHLDPLALFGDRPSIPTVVDMHNVYSSLLYSEALHHHGLLRRYLCREARLLARMEQRAADWADVLLAVSEQDARQLLALGPRRLEVVPNAVDYATYAALPAGRRDGPPLVLYAGSMSWPANVRAACFLATEVLPRIQAHVPGVRLRIVGKDQTAGVKALARLSGVETLGTVPSMLQHFGDAHVLAVPLTAAGGTRLKILEAFAAGLPVVSTRLGCEGLSVAHGEHLLIVECEAFADSIHRLLISPAMREQLAGRARALVRERYDWTKVARLAVAAVAEASQSRAANRHRSCG
jgi:glycosyltransferase involved in cell wall biosynthesis